MTSAAVIPDASSLRELEGEPFTRAHFRAWTRMLRMRGEERFQIEEWELDFAEDVFNGWQEGWLKEAWLIVPEGNGKSTFVAVLIMYFEEFVEDAQIPVAAASRDQAEIIFQQCDGFSRRSPSFKYRFECKPGLREIVFDRTSKAKIFASDASTGDGIVPYPLEVIDELHRHKTLSLYRTWAGKLDKEGAVLIVISTAGEPGSEFEDVRAEMRSSDPEPQIEGCFGRYVGPTSILHEYAVPVDVDVHDLEMVKKANPSSRITVETLRAKMSRPSFSLGHWRRLTCNQPTRLDAVAVTPAEWAGAYVDVEIPQGEAIWLGIDVGWKYDTTALVPLWIRDFNFRLLGDATILEPPGDGTSLSPGAVEDAIAEIRKRNPIHTVVMDVTNAEWLAEKLSEDGLDVVDRNQHNVMAVLDYKRFMEALRKGWLKHTGSRGLETHVLNAISQTLPGGDSKFSRPKESRTVNIEEARRRHIDALQAAAMVHCAAAADLMEPEAEILMAVA